MNKRNLFLFMIAVCTALLLGFGAGADSADKPLALKGYDTVAYFTVARPTVGDPRFEHEWDGAVYRFASSEHLGLFKADPDRYLPQHRGFCTAALSRGEKVVPDPENWLVQDGQLFLFGKPIGPDRMRADSGMEARADANYAKLAEPSGSAQQ